MKETKLLNCPFCGGEAYLREFKELSGITTDYYVECGNIECGVSPETPIFGTPEKAIKAWNTRKPMKKIVERLKKAKRDFNYDNIDNWYMSRKEKEMYEDGVNKAIEIVKEGVIE